MMLPLLRLSSSGVKYRYFLYTVKRNMLFFVCPSERKDRMNRMGRMRSRGAVQYAPSCKSCSSCPNILFRVLGSIIHPGLACTVGRTARRFSDAKTHLKEYTRRKRKETLDDIMNPARTITETLAEGCGIIAEHWRQTAERRGTPAESCGTIAKRRERPQKPSFPSEKPQFTH